MNDWPFAEPPDTLVFTTQPVLDGAPVRDVHHDQDGDWQILCGTTLAAEDARMVHFAHLVEMVPSLAPLADFPRGWSAGKCEDSEHRDWHRRPTTLRARVRGWLRRT
jgi:hypothetical protein